MMKKIAVLVIGETETVLHIHDLDEARKLQKVGAKFIKDNRRAPIDPVSTVGFYLENRMKFAEMPEIQNHIDTHIASIAYDIVFPSETYRCMGPDVFEVPVFCFTAFRQPNGKDVFKYYLRMVLVVGLADVEKMKAQTLLAFRSVQAMNPIQYAADSIANVK